MVEVSVLGTQDLSPTTFVLRLERGAMDFAPGQYVRVGMDPVHMREYTVYSPPAASHLEALIKVVPGGVVSGRLRRLRRGDPVLVDGPFGEFVLPDRVREDHLLFVAAGTGIAPFHCFARSYRDLDYRILHGARSSSELHHRHTYDHDRYTPCLTREPGPGYAGRVTDWLGANPVDPESDCYLCGGYPMISECHEILRSRGIPPRRIHAEVYF